MSWCVNVSGTPRLTLLGGGALRHFVPRPGSAREAQGLADVVAPLAENVRPSLGRRREYEHASGDARRKLAGLPPRQARCRV